MAADSRRGCGTRTAAEAVAGNPRPETGGGTVRASRGPGCGGKADAATDAPALSSLPRRLDGETYAEGPSGLAGGNLTDETYRRIQTCTHAGKSPRPRQEHASRA